MGGIKIKCLIICIKFVRAKPFAFPIGFVCIQFNDDSYDGIQIIRWEEIILCRLWLSCTGQNNRTGSGKFCDIYYCPSLSFYCHVSILVLGRELDFLSVFILIYSCVGKSLIHAWLHFYLASTVCLLLLLCICVMVFNHICIGILLDYIELAEVPIWVLGLHIPF